MTLCPISQQQIVSIILVSICCSYKITFVQFALLYFKVLLIKAKFSGLMYIFAQTVMCKSF